MLPPRLVRRLIIDPLVFALALVLIAVSPVFLLATAIADLFVRGRFRTTRLLCVGIAYLVYEVVGMTLLFGLWIIGGFGLLFRSERIHSWHHGFVGWWLNRLGKSATRFLGLRIELEDPEAPRPGPVLVFPRHAGPGDSILIAQILMAGYRRHPRIVMKDTLQWSPCIDIAGNRLEACFIRPADRQANRFIERIGDLAKDLGDQDAVVLFPEGGNFTVKRREGAIEKLREKGHEEYAERAEQLSHLIAPRPGGALAAIENAPAADVVFVAHTGLEYLSSFQDLWKGIPLSEPVMGRYWRMPPGDVPEGRDAQIEWMYSWWAKIDAWIESHADRYRSAG